MVELISENLINIILVNFRYLKQRGKLFEAQKIFIFKWNIFGTSHGLDSL